MHNSICRLDMILLLNCCEVLSEAQYLELRRVLRVNKSLFSAEQLDDYHLSIYLRRYPRLEAHLLLNLEAYYDLTVKAFLKSAFSKLKLANPYAPPPKSYSTIVEANRLQETYIKREPAHRSYANAHLFDKLLDCDIDENYKCMLFAQNRKVDEQRIIFMTDLLRRRFTQFMRELSDRNSFVRTSIRGYQQRCVQTRQLAHLDHRNYFTNNAENRTPLKTKTYSPTPTSASNYYFRKPSSLIRRTQTPSKDISTRVITETVYERKTHSRSIYQVKRIQLFEDESPLNQAPRGGSTKALKARNSRGVLRAKLQQLNQQAQWAQLNQTTKIDLGDYHR